MVAKLGDFLVNIKTVVNDKDVKNLTKSLGGLTKSAAGVALSLAGITAGTGYGFVKMIKSAVDETAELGRLAKDLAVTPQFLETYMRAFESVGAGAEEAINTIRTLSKESQAFRFGKGNFEAFGMLQASPQDFGDNVGRNLDTIRKLFNARTPKEQLYFVDQIGLGEKALRVLRLNAQEYQNVLKQSSQIPLVTQEQLKAAEEYKKNLIEIDQTLTALKRNLVLAATPAFKAFSGELIKLFNNPDFQKNITQAFEELLKALPQLISMLPAFISAIIKLSDFLVPDATGDAKVDSSFGDRFLHRSTDFLTGGPIYGAVFGLSYKKRMAMAKAQRLSPEQLREREIQRKTGLTIASKNEKLQQDKLDNPNISRIIDTQSRLVNSNISNTYTINIPVQNAGGNLDKGKMNEFAKIITNQIDKNHQITSQSFKSGSIR